MSKNIGVCRLDITPPMGIGLRGYNVDRRADGVLDPIYINTLAFEEDGKKAAVVVCDLLGMYNKRPFEEIKKITAEFGMDEEAMFICSTHTHTGPFIDVAAAPGEARDDDPLYNEWFWRRVRDSVQLALADLTPVKEVRGAEKETKDLAFVRRFQMKDGHYQTWARILDPNILRPASKADESLRTTVFEREDGKEIILVNFQIHPDCIGGTKISADYPGVVRDTVEAARPGSFCVYFDGAEGQMVGTDWFHNHGGNKSDGYGYYRKLGAAIGYEALSCCQRAFPIADAPLSYGRASVTVPTKLDMSLLPEAERIYQLHMEGRDSEFAKNTGEMNCIFSAAREMRRLAQEQLYEMELPISVINFGGLALAGMPGEPFCELGVLVREGSPYEMTYVCCQCNQSMNYYPTAESYEQGGYEPSNSRLKPGAMEALAQLTVDTLKKLHG